MKLTILGRNGAYPDASGGCSGYLIETEKTKLVVDLGSGTLPVLQERADLSTLDAVILTHLHYDHMSDMLVMAYQLLHTGRKKKLPVFVPDGPAHVLKCLECDAYELRPHGDTVIGDIEVRMIPALHPVPGVSLRLCAEGRSIVLSGDTNMHEALPEFVRGADLLLGDAAFPRRDWTPEKPHMSVEGVARLAKEGGVGKLILTHIFTRYREEEILEEARGICPDAVIAEKGMTIDV